jgi:hypothetical protein
MHRKRCSILPNSTNGSQSSVQIGTDDGAIDMDSIPQAALPGDEAKWPNIAAGMNSGTHLSIPF